MAGKERGTSPRKLDHLRICVEQNVEWGSPGFDDVRLVHNAIPECDMDRIETKVRFLGRDLASPLFIAGMTGGPRETKEVNRRLAAAAERFGIGLGLGSCRAAIEDPSLEDSFSIAREVAPHAFIVANIGVVQLRDHGNEWADLAVEMVDADALAVHLNFLQEALQPEGDHEARGCLEAIETLCREVKYPVIAKETGSGISAKTAGMLYGAGVSAIDIGGWGGTSWPVIEGVRAEEGCRPEEQELFATSRLFRDWGIPTVVSLCDVARRGGPVIATGGVRTGIDIAKGIALGADLCGMALPLLAPALEGEEYLVAKITAINRQLVTAMFLCGSARIEEQKDTKVFITGLTRQMVDEIMEEYNGY